MTLLDLEYLRWVSRQFSEITKQGARLIKRAAKEGYSDAVILKDFFFFESTHDMPERRRLVAKLVRFYEKQDFEVDFSNCGPIDGFNKCLSVNWQPKPILGLFYFDVNLKRSHKVSIRVIL